MAMDEELARDEDVFLMGEEVALYDGAYKVDLFTCYSWFIATFDTWYALCFISTDINEFSNFAG